MILILATRCTPVPPIIDICAPFQLYSGDKAGLLNAPRRSQATHGLMVMARFRDCPDVMLSEALHWLRVVSLGIRTHFVSFRDESLPLIILELNGEVISQCGACSTRAGHQSTASNQATID